LYFFAALSSQFEHQEVESFCDELIAKYTALVQRVLREPMPYVSLKSNGNAPAGNERKQYSYSGDKVSICY